MDAPSIDWESSETHLLLNPRMPEKERRRVEALAATAPPLPAHVWIATSGTSGSLKLTALSKRAVLASAAAVNQHLAATADDVWCSVLPTFHVGGMGIRARAFLTGARVTEMTWDAGEFARICETQRVTLSALVPAQLRDLVNARLHAADSLRAIVIGGGALDPKLYAEARQLGWPVLPSYGMTECCSQAATAGLASLASASFPELELLSHLQARSQSDGLLALRGSSLLTGYAVEREGAAQFVDPKIDGWFITKDVGEVIASGSRTLLRVEGRRGEFVKIGGESVDLSRLQQIVERIAGEMGLRSDAAVVALANERLGHVIHLAVAGEEGERIRERFNAEVLPFERARAIHRVASIPRTSLGKLIRARLELPS